MQEVNGREEKKDNDLFFTCSLMIILPEKQKIKEMLL